MPELIFTVRWPDGRTDDCYSPSLVIHDHLRVGDRLPVAEFADRAGQALQQASDRVRARYGTPCGRAAATAAAITGRARCYRADEMVEVVDLRPPAQEVPR